jgi:nucleolar MIF4G domain-containing protein 1
LNRALNRLSEETLARTVQALAALYDKFPAAAVNRELWRGLRSLCVARHALSTGAAPLCGAALSGLAGWLASGGAGGGGRGASHAGVGEHLAEQIVRELWGYLSGPSSAAASAGTAPPRGDDGADDAPSVEDKTPSNLVLLLGYMYNFGVVHCTLVYGIVRRLVELSSSSPPSSTAAAAAHHHQQHQQAELAVELLLILLGHCGRALRADDPTALREIVASVVRSRGGAGAAPPSGSSRADHMVAALLDLKNNKRRRQDAAHADRTARLRKLVGQVRRGGPSGSSSSSTSACLRITLEDILHADARGRWWKVGASWAGNRLRDPAESDPRNGAASLQDPSASALSPAKAPGAAVDEGLLKLASKLRMNTDLRRSVFCVVVGSDDCDDALEKLARGGMLRARAEREAVRVLVECCGAERSFNMFYPHLARRMCEHQPQCKFSLKLALWDAFKQFGTMKARKAANLARLAFELVAVHRCLRLSVLRPVDAAAPEDLPEPALVFLTVFFSRVMRHFDDPSQVTDLFRSGIGSSKRGRRKKRRRREGSFDRGAQRGDDPWGSSGSEGEWDEDEADGEREGLDGGDALRAGFLVFFVQVLKKSPEYAGAGEDEGAGGPNRFRRNLRAAIRACDVDALFE